MAIVGSITAISIVAMCTGNDGIIVGRCLDVLIGLGVGAGIMAIEQKIEQK